MREPVAIRVAFAALRQLCSADACKAELLESRRALPALHSVLDEYWDEPAVTEQVGGGLVPGIALDSGKAGGGGAMGAPSQVPRLSIRRAPVQPADIMERGSRWRRPNHCPSAQPGVPSSAPSDPETPAGAGLAHQRDTTQPRRGG